MRLHDNSYRGGKLEYRTRHATEPEWALDSYLKDAERIVADAEAEFRSTQADVDAPLPDDAERLRWFPLPAEIMAELQGTASPRSHPMALGA
jgi:hypothetical protein